MIPGLDFSVFGHGVRSRARAVYARLARRYTQLAREESKRGDAVPTFTKALEGKQRKRAAPTSRSFAHLAQPMQSEIQHEATLQEQKRLAELFKLAAGRTGGIDFALKLLNEHHLETTHIAAALRTFPEATRRGGLAARIVARDALTATPTGTPPNAAAEMIKAYNSALGIQS